MQAFIAPSKEDQSDFEAACEKFRSVCNKIANWLGNPDFKGGIDEVQQIFEKSQDGNADDKLTALLLHAEWQTANTELQYQAGRLNIRSPECWYQCWNIAKEFEQ